MLSFSFCSCLCSLSILPSPRQCTLLWAQIYSALSAFLWCLQPYCLFECPAKYVWFFLSLSCCSLCIQVLYSRNFVHRGQLYLSTTLISNCALTPKTVFRWLPAITVRLYSSTHLSFTSNICYHNLGHLGHRNVRNTSFNGERFSQSWHIAGVGRWWVWSKGRF